MRETPPSPPPPLSGSMKSKCTALRPRPDDKAQSETVFLNFFKQESISPAYVAWRAGTTTRFLVPTDCSKIIALAGRFDNPIRTRFLDRIDCSKIPALATVQLGTDECYHQPGENSAGCCKSDWQKYKGTGT